MVMHCSRCMVEYRDGFSVCADCGAQLLHGEPPNDATPVMVFESGDAALVPVVKSMLQDARIEFEARGEALQDLLAGGRMGAGYDIASGPIRFFVSSADAEDAREIIAHLSETPDDASAESEPHDDPDAMFSELMALEERGWEALSTSAGAAREFYGSVLHEECVMVFPGGLLLEGRDAILKSLDAIAWSSFDLAESRLVWLGPGALMVVYRAQATRGSSDSYEALVSSTYLRLDGEWMLAAHQQTPV